MNWHLKRIPKIVHFYWGHKTLPYLRYLTIYSFHKLNPDWEIRYYYPKKCIDEMTWDSNELKYNIDCKDYTKALKKKGIKMIKFDMEDIGLSNEISEVHKAGFFRQYILSTVGGLSADMDIIFFKPLSSIPINTKENGNITNILSIHSDYTNVAFQFSSPENLYYKKSLELSKKNYLKTSYQCIGATLLRNEYPELEIVRKKFPELTVMNLPLDVIYAYDAYVIRLIFESEDTSKYTKNSIGLHWFAGNHITEKYINELTHLNYKKYNNVLCKTIREVYK